MPEKEKFFKKGENLFVSSGECSELADIGWSKNRGIEFAAYTEGYKNAADELVKLAVESGDRKKRDTYVFPICFLYRQFLELEMKELFMEYSTKTKKEKEEIIKNVSHDLEGIWGEVESILKKYFDDYKDDIRILKERIKDFNEIDKKSFEFRYPITKNLDRVDLLENRKMINLNELKERMNEMVRPQKG